MTSTIASDICRVHALGYDFVVVNNDAADGRLVGAERKASLRKSVSLFSLENLTSAAHTMSKAWSMKPW
ncbi:hypothetical protein VDGD_20768 [Verticillium dahliae]|nr:hypothetical protein VDGD_20768 [Verticillium dahliae]